MTQITIRNYINGQWQEEAGAPTVPLYNPSTGEQISQVPQSGPETSKMAVDTAAAAYPGWRRTSIGKRVAYIYKMREALLQRKEDLAQAIALDQAKHISE
ncbi:MAG: aldehyde dehydrogenase family protein, partial [Desulfovibrio sp.]|nr:aldehyde dehydrogenase family protein [Desulfovibrio sp.]